MVQRIGFSGKRLADGFSGKGLEFGSQGLLLRVQGLGIV
jgi:hypothetical protein